MIHMRAKNVRQVNPFKSAAVLVALLAMGLCPLSAFGFDILVGTGAEGTLSYHTGRTVCRIISRQHEDIGCTAAPAAGDIHNLTNLRGGSLDIALVDSRMLSDAINKAGYFEFFDITYDNLRTLSSLYHVPVSLVARSDANIDALTSLKGKRINSGAARTPQRLATETLFRAKNWSETDFSLVAELPSSQSQDTMAFCHGTVQAMLHIGVHPDPALQQLFKLCDARLISMNDDDIQKMVADNPAFSMLELPAGLYPTIAQPLSTYGTRMVMVTSEDLDEETAYRIMAALAAGQSKMKSIHPALADLKLGGEREDAIGIQMHPGAARFIAEQP